MKIASPTLALVLTTSASASDGPLPVLTDETKPLFVQLLGEARDVRYITQQQYDETLHWLDARPCDGLERSVPDAKRRQLEAAMSDHLKRGEVRVRAVLAIDGWYAVSPRALRGVVAPYYFFGDAKDRGRAPVAEWYGPTAIYKTSERAQWVMNNAKGIPDRLANCFAWSVSFDKF